MFDQNKIQEMNQKIEEIHEFAEEIATEWTKLTGIKGLGEFNVASFGDFDLKFGVNDPHYGEEAQYIPWRFVTDTEEYVKEYKQKQKKKQAQEKAAATRKQNQEIKLLKQLQEKYKGI